jgi:hypothetical protein
VQPLWISHGQGRYTGVFCGKDFCDASRSIAEEHDIYWAEFSMLATQHGADLLASTGLPLSFTTANFFTQEELRSSELETLDIHMPLTLVEPTCCIDMKEALRRLLRNKGNANSANCSFGGSHFIKRDLSLIKIRKTAIARREVFRMT